jgi:glycosyltransferase involved in cell wall biosynthesis
MAMRHAIERVVVINDDSVRSGGAAGIMLASIRQLRARDVPVTLLTGDDGSNPELARLGVDVVSLGGQHILEGARVDAAARGLYSRKTARLLQEWIDANDTPGTVYHLHNWHKVLSASAFVPLRQVAARLVLSAHDYFLACPNGGYYHYPRGKACDLTPLGPRCLAAACDKRNYAHKLWRVARGAIRATVFNFHDAPATVLAVHDGMIPLLERGGIPLRSIEVLRNPVTPWRMSRVAAERNGTFLFVGRLEEDKGVTLLARAARETGLPVRMIGTGPLAETLQRDYPEIEMTGWKSPKEIAQLCLEARALVMPSRWRETFGLSAIEAAMSGIPVIASRATLISEDLERIGAGVGCEADNLTALSQAMTSLAQDDLAAARMSHRGFEHARELAPTPGEWGEKLIDIYGAKLSAAKALIPDVPGRLSAADPSPGAVSTSPNA